MIWRKAWLESRGRFLLMGVALALTALAAILDAERQMARYDSMPRSAAASSHDRNPLSSPSYGTPACSS